MFRTLNNKAYRVGGNVRNKFLGVPAADEDFVVVATVEEFEATFPDAEKVGNHFPVYLHPETGDEVALTRTEQSSGDSYQEFELLGVGVDIVDDLGRRDFSINSIAEHYVTGEIVDPHNGIQDIKNKVLRTINDKFVKEDPIRVYRLARFAAEFDFTIEKHTAHIVKRDAEYIKNVKTERVYAELKKVYERSAQPSIFFRTLFHLDVLKYHFKPLFVAAFVPAGPSKWHGNRSVFDHLLDSFDNAKANGHNFSVAIASLVHDFGKIITRRSELPSHHAHEVRGVKLIEAFFKQHRFDAHTVELAKTASRQHMTFHYLTEIKKPVKLVRFYKKIRNNVEEITAVAINDHGVAPAERAILAKLEEAFRTTEINIPENVKAKGREAIVAFVENEYTKTYRSL